MDIYTAASRLSHTFVVDGEALPLGHHALIGDGLTCALVGVDGGLNWLCMPHFDSPSIFARILDTEQGGFFRIRPSVKPCESLQAYDDNTNVLQTLFRVPDQGVAVLTDFMPWTDDPRSSMHEVHRMVEVREGSLEIEIQFDPRFDYGRAATRLETTEHGVIATGPAGESLSLSVSGGLKFERQPTQGVTARVRLRPGHRLWAILSWNSPRPEPSAAYRPFEHLRTTRRFWRSWASRLRYDGPWRHDVLRSALVLKLLQFGPSGAMVAAATTSLPVWPGGSRNWDYRFSWARDSALATRAMNLIGYRDEARGFFHFVRDSIDRRGGLDLMVTIHGEPVPEEETLDHWTGHLNSKPVRIGNAAKDQRQLDITGVILDAAFLYERTGGSINMRLWRELRGVVTTAMARCQEPDHGIWEPRGEPAHHVHSKLMTWVAFDRALRLSPLFGGDRDDTAWAQARHSIRQEILQQGYNESFGTFVGEYGGSEVDATLLLFPLYGFLPASDPRVVRTRQRIVKELATGRFLHRYHTSDGIDCEEGAFALCGYWLAEALALAGELDEALEVFHEHARAANHVGLLSEELDVASGAPLGNLPQAFSHLGLIQAAARLDLALRLRDEGAERPPRHVMDLPDGF